MPLPVFGKSSSPFEFTVKRFQPPVLKLNELPKVDIVLIAHDHYYHLEMKSINYFKDEDVTFYYTTGVCLNYRYIHGSKQFRKFQNSKNIIKLIY